MATEISAVISWHEVLHPDIGDRGKWNFPWHGTAGQCWERFVADGDTAGVSARRVISPTATAQHHSQATYLADGALGVNSCLKGKVFINIVHIKFLSCRNFVGQRVTCGRDRCHHVNEEEK